MRATLEKDGQHVGLTFPYNPILIDKVKQLPGRKYRPKDRAWVVPISEHVVEKLKEWGFEIPHSIAGRKHTPLSEMVITPDEIRLLQQLRDVPFRQYQRQGIIQMIRWGGRALLADDTGLGKTRQALGVILLLRSLPALIVTPATAKLGWAREIEQHFSVSYELLEGQTPYSLHNHKGSILLINYDILSHWVPELQKLGIKFLALDEAHYIKNRKAQRTLAVRTIAKGVDYVIPISATPFTNRPIEMYNAIHLVNPHLFGGVWDFARRYCDAKHDGYGWNLSGSSNTEELHDILTKTIMVRRRKADVMGQLPAKTRTIVPLKLDRKEYDKRTQEFDSWLEKNSDNPAQAMVEVEKMKQAAVMGKMKELIKWAEDFLESGEKLLLFFNHTEPLKMVARHFGEICMRVEGGMGAAKKKEAENKFQTDPKCRLGLLNIKAGGVSITLTAASNVGFVELPWTPGDLTQAEDRVYGRINDPHGANIWFLCALGTIEEQIAKLIDEKAQVFSQVIDGQDVPMETMITDLLKQWRS